MSSESVSNLSLSIASEALDTNSLRKISLLFHPIFLNLTCAYPYLYNLMLTASYVCRPYSNSYSYYVTIWSGCYFHWMASQNRWLHSKSSSCILVTSCILQLTANALFRLTWVSYQLKTKISLIIIYQNNDIVMGISLYIKNHFNLWNNQLSVYIFIFNNISLFI
jgi:hypothetical protein